MCNRQKPQCLGAPNIAPEPPANGFQCHATARLSGVHEECVSAILRNIMHLWGDGQPRGGASFLCISGVEEEVVWIANALGSNKFLKQVRLCECKA